MVMQRLKACDFPQPVLDLFDGYIHGRLTRRDFMEGARKYAVAGFSAAAMLEALRPNFAWGEQVAPSDARIKAEWVEYPAPQGSGTGKGYLAMPAKMSGTAGCIVVVHENRGLNPHIQDIARRLAVDGFVAFAPDALAPVGGYPGDEEKAVAMFGKLDPKKRTEDLMAAVPYLRSRGECNGKMGAVGFCFGGSTVNMMAVRYPDLAAVVPFYGAQPNAEDTAKIRAPLLIHYAANDERIDSGWPAWEQALKANHVKYEMHMYPNTQHGFNNDTTPRYDEAAAKQAWARTVAFFKEKLG
jgi:carboxymethylenebutenolidase